MLHYVHQLVAHFVCLAFGAEQVVYSGFFFLAFSLQPAAYCGQRRCYKSSESEPKLWVRKPKQ